MPPRRSSAATTDPAAPDPTEFRPTAPLKASGLQQMGSAIGGVIAGIEQQVFGRPPPGPVLVRHATPSGGKGPDGTEFVLDFPDGTDATHASQTTHKRSRKGADKAS